ncbi:LPS export ABC transporter periplasmic protein LptC [Parahaliea mediterranea]|uniref:LPS export ABC transporter periplasmic protein LptC n=1 Tax=Parahaliea mediterranea TaxID=651086 RepID=A0A939IKD5_9GAMM|nr:LPS export ABC transporter periplasmic protein LptC [Parahaliea mediterranea]MBN7795345.1 LPS export ABC transporter periplasmic protein LptC [Parahaliea mediterranea]
MQKTAVQVFVAITLVLLASYYWSPGGSPDADPATVARRQALAQTYLYDTRSWEYDEDGALTEALEASRAEYYARRKVSELTQPRFYSHDGNDRTWSASADRGIYRHRAEVLQLRSSVNLSNDQTGGVLNTQAMTLNLKNNTATSKVPVTITQGPNTIRADGMEADLNLERIVMKPNVESTYVAPRT